MRKHSLIVAVAASLATSAVTLASNNFPTSGTLPEVIYLRINCETTPNCATTVPEVQTWINTYKHPSATAPLLVQIGPGTFNGSFTCNGWSRVSFKGAGPNQTKIAGVSSAGAAFTGSNCFDLNVQDITFTMATGEAILSAISWNRGGSSTWNNVSTEAVATYAWTESACPSDPAQAPVHRWFSSHLQGTTKAYEVQCSKNWFFGSQVQTIAGGADVSVFYIHTGVNSTNMPEVNMYGGNISMILPAGSMFNSVTAVEAVNNAMVHIHGTGIDIIGNEKPNVVTGLEALDGAMIHANGAAYNLSTGAGGQIWRISNSAGDLRAPYVWEPSLTPPNVYTENGADTVVVTGTANGHPHSLVSDNSCAARWYDNTTNACY